jgi:uncharacterized protein (DUF983 family)
MKINKKIEEKADEIIQKDSIINCYLMKCKKARICPECGESIIHMRESFFEFGDKCSKCNWNDIANYTTED